ASRNVVELDALMPMYGAVVVAERHHQRRLHRRDAEDRRVPDVGRQILPERYLHALLAGFDVIGFGDARAPVMVAVVRDQIGSWRGWDRGREEVGVRGEKHRIEAAPRVTDDPHARRIRNAHRDRTLYRRADAFSDRQSGLTWTEYDVRLEHDIAQAGE